jgi:hypothetical protein
MAQKKVTIKLEAEVGALKEELDALKKSIDKNAKASDNFRKEATKDFKQTTKSADKLQKETKQVNKAFVGLGTVIKAGIGLNLVGRAMDGVSEAFMTNQRTQDTWSTVTETFKTVLNKVVMVLWDTFDAASEVGGVFDNISKMMSTAWNYGMANFNKTVESVSLSWNKATFAMKQFFGADPKELEVLSNSIKKSEDTIKGLEASMRKDFKKTVEIGAEVIVESGKIAKKAREELSKIDVKAEFDTQKKITKLKNDAAIKMAENEKIIFKKQREAELKRQIRDDITKPLKERQEANKELGKILDEQEKKMSENAQANLNLANEIFKLDEKNIEATVLKIQAEKELLDIKEAKAGFESEQLTNEVALGQEVIDMNNTQIESLNARTIEERKANAERILDEVTRIETLKAIAEEEKALEEERLENDILNYQIGTQARVDAEQALYDFQTQNAIEQEDLKIQLAEANKKRIHEGLDAVIKAAGAESKVGRALFIAKQAMLIKEQIAEAKATLSRITLKAAETGVAVAEGTGNTAKVGFPQNVPLLIAFAVQAAGIISSVKSAVNAAKGQASKMGSAGGGGGVSLSAPQAQAAAPNFNIVGATAENQLAQTMSQQNQTPIKAFVVSNDVTTAQSMDRNIIESSSI